MPSQETPRGSTTRLHGLDSYITEPSDGRPIEGVVVVVSDAFGWEFENTRLLADHYADKGGYRVVVPDFLGGVALSPSTVESLRGYFGGSLLGKAYSAIWLALAWIPFLVYQNILRRSSPTSTVATFFSAVSHGPEAKRGLPVFAAGLSWGGRYALSLASMPKPPVTAVFVAHPSQVTVPDDLARLTVPVSFALAKEDHALGGDERIAEVQRVVGKSAAKCEVKAYSAGHSFCVRADFTGKDTSAQADEAEDQAINWFRSQSP
ncbi:hypothetical protein PspLS_01763 [Pyricularia sp. CBS 133598]|nr:hypothetical protein PspLS_01763 [Pyricularia sp. CBS 133598]